MNYETYRDKTNNLSRYGEHKGRNCWSSYIYSYFKSTHSSRYIKYASLRYISLIKLVYISAAVMFYT